MRINVCLLVVTTLLVFGCQSDSTTTGNGTPIEDSDTPTGDSTPSSDDTPTVITNPSTSDSTPPIDSAQPESGGVFTTTNYKTVLINIFSIMNSLELESFIGKTDAIPTPILSEANNDIAGLTLENRFFSSETGQDVLEFACSTGGRYTFKQKGPFELLYEFDNCQLMNRTFNGNFTTILSEGTTETLYNSFEITDENKLFQTLTGKRYIRSNRFVNSIKYEVASFKSGSANDFLELVYLETDINHNIASPAPNPGERSLTSEFTVQAPWTRGQQIGVETKALFSSKENNANYSTGMLYAIANSNSRLTVNADNGDPDTIQIDVVADGGTSSFVESWSGQLRLRCIGDPYSAEPEFLCDD